MGTQIRRNRFRPASPDAGSDIGNILLTAPNLRILDEEFEKRLQDFVSRLRVSRHIHKDASEWSQKVVEKFGNKLTKEDPEENS